MGTIIKDFKFWCNKILPLVYDDSLSYYEVLCKLKAKVNEIITATEENSNGIIELKEWVENELNAIGESGLLPVTNQIQSKPAHTSVYNKQIAMIDENGQLFGDSININDIMIKPRRTANNALACFDDNGRLTPLCFDENTPLVTLDQILFQNYFYDRPDEDDALELSNGFKIAYGVFSITSVTPTQIGSTGFYRQNITINHNFKRPFLRKPKLLISPTIDNLDNVCLIGGYTFDVEKILRINLLSYQSATINPKFNYIAVGF